MSETQEIPGEPVPTPRRGLRVTTLMLWVLIVGGSVGMIGRPVA